MLTIRAINLESEIEIQSAKQIYLTSFPEAERLPFDELIRKTTAGKGHYLGLFQEERLCGMIYYVTTEELIYIFYFAIDQTIQSKGYGKFALAYMKEMFPKQKHMLLIEELKTDADNFEQRMRRKNFYEKNNFVLTGTKIIAADVCYELMSSGETIATATEYERVQDYFYTDDIK